LLGTETGENWVCLIFKLRGEERRGEERRESVSS
jgi:hypothetical protein